MNVMVVGVGHVGLPTALMLARRGHEVVGLDTNLELVRKLQRGIPPFFEPGLADLLGTIDGHVGFRSMAELRAATRVFDAAVMCVDTPTLASGQADLSRLESSVALVADSAVHGMHIAIRSTVPPGTTARIAGETASSHPRIHLSFSHIPEFLRQGSALADLENPWRIVIGADTNKAKEIACHLFDHETAPVELMTTRAAELVKCAANTYLALRLSYVNLMAELSEALGADFSEVCRGLGSDPRIGRDFLTPGIGFGGPCLPKDLRSMTSLLKEAGVPPSLLQDVQDLNEHARRRVADLIAVELQRGDRVAVFGLTFKGGTDSVRESPAMLLAQELQDRGASVVGFDPSLLETAAGTLLLPLACSMIEAASGAKAIVIGADWQEFCALDWNCVAAVSAPNATVFDCRCVLSSEAVEAAGLRYYRPGRGFSVGRKSVPSEGAFAAVRDT